MMEEREILAMQNGGAAAGLPEAALLAQMTEATEPAAAPRVDRLAISRQRTYTAELMKAHVALLEREVILSKNIDLFRLVNRHYYTLQSWHDTNTGWRIQRSATVIRLVRQLSATTPGYVYDRLRDPGDFACLTWILWYAENRQLTGRGNDQQFLLSQLAEQISEQSRSGNDGEAAFDFRRPADRYSIQRALQYLEELGALQLVDGQTKEWGCDTFSGFSAQPAITGIGGSQTQRRGANTPIHTALAYGWRPFSGCKCATARASMACTAARPSTVQIR